MYIVCFGDKLNKLFDTFISFFDGPSLALQCVLWVFHAALSGTSEGCVNYFGFFL